MVSKSCGVFGLELKGLLLFRGQILALDYILAWSSDDWLLLGLDLMVLDRVSSLEEVKSDLISILLLIESDLHTALSCGDTSQVVDVEVGGDHVLHSGDLSDSLLVDV